MVVVFYVACCLFVAFFAPIMPSFRTYMLAYLTVHEQSISVWTPWTTEITLVHTVEAGDTAVVEHISVRLSFRSR